MPGLVVKPVDLRRTDYCTLCMRLAPVAGVSTEPHAHPETVRECRDFVLENLLRREWGWEHFSWSGLLGRLRTLSRRGRLFCYRVARRGRRLCWWMRGIHSRPRSRDEITLHNRDDQFRASSTSYCDPCFTSFRKPVHHPDCRKGYTSVDRRPPCPVASPATFGAFATQKPRARARDKLSTNASVLLPLVRSNPAPI